MISIVTFGVILLLVFAFLLSIKQSEKEKAEKEKLEKEKKDEEERLKFEEWKKEVKKREEEANRILAERTMALEKERKEKEQRERMQAIRERQREEQLKKDKPETLAISAFSPNNKINYISPTNGIFVCSIENKKIGRSETFFLNSKKDVIDFLESVLYCWSKQEDNLLYYPSAAFPFKQLRNKYVNIVGMKFREDEAQNKVSILYPGCLILFAPERNNLADSNAIGVYTADGYHIGYVSAKFCEDLIDEYDGVFMGWMSTKWQKGKGVFSVAIVSGKDKKENIKEEDILE